MLARVTALRLDAGLDQGTMAKIAGWKNCNWCHLERGRVKLPKKRREIVAEYFGVPEELLFKDNGEVVAVSREELIPA